MNTALPTPKFSAVGLDGSSITFHERILTSPSPLPLSTPHPNIGFYRSRPHPWRMAKVPFPPAKYGLWLAIVIIGAVLLLMLLGIVPL